MPLRTSSDPERRPAPSERAVEALLRMSLLTLPFYGPDRSAAEAVTEAFVAFAQWILFESEPYERLDTPALRAALTSLARIARARG